MTICRTSSERQERTWMFRWHMSRTCIVGWASSRSQRATQWAGHIPGLRLHSSTQSRAPWQPTSWCKFQGCCRLSPSQRGREHQGSKYGSLLQIQTFMEVTGKRPRSWCSHSSYVNHKYLYSARGSEIRTAASSSTWELLDQPSILSIIQTSKPNP